MSEALEKCASPTCEVKFEPSGLAMEPKRYCCDACKMDVYALRRVRKLLEGLSDQRVLEIVRGKP